jgi:glycosyltransferase involved in cell wall biosynthesis
VKVLYLAPLVPSVSGNGGKRAVFNHLQDVANTTTDVDLFVVDVDDRGDKIPGAFDAFRGRVFPRALPRLRGWSGLFAAAVQWLFDIRPRAAAVVASEAAKQAVRHALSTNTYDLIVVDHLNAWSILQSIVTDVPIHYISHNIETDVLHDQRSQGRYFSIRGMRLSVELWKMARYEKSILKSASFVTAISAGDYDSDFFRPIRSKAVVWPELPEVKATMWSSPNSKQLLFVGSASYFPNYDAIEWLVLKFMPALIRVAPEIVLRIAGTSREEMSKLPIPSQVIFEGFVTADRLDELHRTSAAFICPVVLGSGIKIKVLEASSYGLPIVATEESLRGINYLEGAVLRIERDPESDAREVSCLLHDKERLDYFGLRATQQLQHARSVRAPLLDPLLKANVLEGGISRTCTS